MEKANFAYTIIVSVVGAIFLALLFTIAWNIALTELFGLKSIDIQKSLCLLMILAVITRIIVFFTQDIFGMQKRIDKLFKQFGEN